MKKKSLVPKQKKISLKKAAIVSLGQKELGQVAGGGIVRSYANPCYTVVKCIIE